MRNRLSYYLVPALLAGAIALPTSAVAQTAPAAQTRVVGTVVDLETQKPLEGVTVRVLGTSSAAITNAQGGFLIANAPVGTFNLEARRIGYGVGRRDNIRILRDSTVTLRFELRDNPLRLEAVVTAATLDPRQSLNTPYTVGQLSADDIPVLPTVSAAGAVQGKVAGVQIVRGRGPGAGVNIQLRSPTSQEKTNSPIFVVDGVVLATQASVTTADIESMDIASIEVIKGAAAASLYGSLGANGVISITTNRGAQLQLNTTQFSVRTESGINSFTRVPEKPKYHHYRVNAQGQYVDAAGNVVSRRQRVADPIGFKDKAYIDPLYDASKEFFKAGQFRATTVQLQQNTASTNFGVTYARQGDQGAVIGANGAFRQNLRVNLDHRRGEKLLFSVGAYHQRQTQDPPAISWSNLFALDPDVNIDVKTPDGRYVVLPDSNSTIVNPLYRQFTLQDWRTDRARTQLNTTTNYKIHPTLSVNANFNYDRADRAFEDFIPRGILGTDGQTPTLGSYQRDVDLVETANGGGGLTWTDRFGAFAPRISIQGLLRRETNPFTRAIASDFSVAGVRDLDVGQTRTISSSYTDRRQQSALLNATVDYADKVVGDFSIQREGNSLYGPGSRWNNWYRASGSYRLAEEAWWPIAALNEFRLRYSYGSAGNRPSFYDQFETLELQSGGLPSRQSFGNKNLRPEVATEQEFGLDAVYRNRYSLSLVYARQQTRDNIISIPLPALTGFNTQEQNVGVTQGRTIEATIQAQIVQRRGLSWEMNLVADRTRSKLVKFGRSCYTDGIRYRCEGAALDEMWGNRYVYSLDRLPARHANSQGAFQVNDDGFVVPVGVGNNWTEGVSKNLWGTTVMVDGVRYNWGRPITEIDSLGRPAYVKIGNALPDLNFGYGNTVKWKGMQLYALFTGQRGGNVYNNIAQSLYASADHPKTVQAGKPEERKKPLSYYTAADGISANNSNWNSAFVEDGSYVKLAEAQLRWTLPQRIISRLGSVGADRIALELTGRNLATWTKYTGIDPEAGSPLYRVDDALYPLYRTLSASVHLIF